MVFLRFSPRCFNSWTLTTQLSHNPLKDLLLLLLLLLLRFLPLLLIRLLFKKRAVANKEMKIIKNHLSPIVSDWNVTAAAIATPALPRYHDFSSHTFNTQHWFLCCSWSLIANIKILSTSDRFATTDGTFCFGTTLKTTSVELLLHIKILFSTLRWLITNNPPNFYLLVLPRMRTLKLLPQLMLPQHRHVLSSI